MFDKPEPVRCAMEGCPKSLEHKGGGFIFSREKNAFFCEDCYRLMAGNQTIFNAGKNLWEFTTTHFNGEKIHVRNLSHLRQLEKQYGCSNHAANFMEGQWSTPPSHSGNPNAVIPREFMHHGSYRPEERR